MSSPSILITGATSGIGRALALKYAELKCDLFLFGRHQSRLQDVRKDCEALGARVQSFAVDVRDESAMNMAIAKILDSHSLDIVIANAGISVGQRERTRALQKDLFATNVDGVLNTVMPIIPHFQSKQSGHIVVMSSLAAFQVFPSRGEYAATKIAVRYFADMWRQSLAADNIFVTSIHPGFVRTPLTDKNKHRMPGIISAEKAADIIVTGLSHKKAVIAFPMMGYIFVRILQALPTRLSDWVALLAQPK